MIIDRDNPALPQEIGQFLADNGVKIENIPVTIIVNPPIQAIIENVGRLSEVLVELLDAYRTEGDYFLELLKSQAGIVVAFGIGHSAASYIGESGRC